MKKSILATNVWIFCLVFGFSLFYYVRAQTCTAIDQCSCRTTDGKILTLWDIDKRYVIQSASGPFSYAYRPCTGLKECNGALGCQIAGGKNTVIAYKPKYIDAGRDDTTNLYTFQYIGDMDPDIKKKVQFKILLKCDKTKDAQFIKMVACEIGTCLVELTTKCACPGTCNLPKSNSGNSGNKQISMGSILCIVLLVLVLVYVFAGIAINKFALHKEGSDVIPQRTFWTDVPSLVKDGCIFTYQTLRKRKGDYQEI